MIEEVARQMLTLIGVDHIGVRPGWVTSCCPLAPWTHKGGQDRSPSFGIKVVPGEESFYTCFACGRNGDPGFLTEELYHLNHKTPRYNQAKLAEAWKFVRDHDQDLFIPTWDPSIGQPKQVVRWPEWVVDQYDSWDASTEVSKYLCSREVYSEVADALELKVDHKLGAVVFPIRDFEGFLVGMRGRVLDPEAKLRFMDYKHNGVTNTGQVWLGENRVTHRKPLVIVEGNFDYARVFGVYTNVVAALGATPNADKLKRLAWAWQVILFLDHDEAGQQAAVRMERFFERNDCVVERVSYPPGLKDPGSMTDDQVRECLSEFVNC